MSRFIAPAALVIAILSLALNVFLLTRLNNARGSTLAVLDYTSQRLDSLADASIKQTVRVNQSFSVAGDMPFKQDFIVPFSMTIPVKTTVPINTVIPINTTVNVSVNTPLGPLNVPVPINTTVPVNLQVPVSMTMPVDLKVPVTFSQTVPYSMTVPVDVQVPVEIQMRDVGIESVIKEVQQEIQQLRGAMQ